MPSDSIRKSRSVTQCGRFDPLGVTTCSSAPWITTWPMRFRSPAPASCAASRAAACSASATDAIFCVNEELPDAGWTTFRQGVFFSSNSLSPLLAVAVQIGGRFGRGRRGRRGCRRFGRVFFGRFFGGRAAGFGFGRGLGRERGGFRGGGGRGG